MSGPHGSCRETPGRGPERGAKEADAEFLAEIILMASRSPEGLGIWNLLGFEDDADRRAFIEYLVLGSPSSVCHHGRFLISDHDSQQAAALAAYNPGQPGLVPLAPAIASALAELGTPDADLGRTMDRLIAFQEVNPDPRPDAWTIEWVATLPAFRGLGLVAGLVNAALHTGRELGFGWSQVSTYLENTAARRLYERAGFVEATRRESDAFLAMTGSRGLVRFERRL